MISSFKNSFLKNSLLNDLIFQKRLLPSSSSSSSSSSFLLFLFLFLFFFFLVGINSWYLLLDNNSFFTATMCKDN
jgi:hypothetical protein